MDQMPIMRFLGIRIDVPPEDGVYVAELDATPDTMNFLGTVHGAAIAALIDHAGVLRAESRVQRAGRTLIVMDVRVTDQDGRLIAVADMALAPAAE